MQSVNQFKILYSSLMGNLKEMSGKHKKKKTKLKVIIMNKIYML